MEQNQQQLDYFALKEKTDLASELDSKMRAWCSQVAGSGLKDRWIKCYRYYYGRHFGGRYQSEESGIQEAGDSGEFKLLTVNHYRNLLKHIHILTTNQKPAFDVRAINSDADSLAQSRLANSILDAYLREKRLARHLKNAAEHALVFGKGFVYITWEPSLGKPYAVSQRPMADGTVVPRLEYEGDVEVSTPSAFDVYVDQSQEDWTKIEWVTIRTWRNKYNLAVRYPEMSQDVLRLETKGEADNNLRYTFQSIDETADVPVYAFYHKRTDALPNGRYMLFCDDTTVLYDGPIPYPELPIFRIVPGEIFGTTEGYSDGFDLLPIQEALNVLESTTFSNESAFGVQNILLPEGCNISEETLSQGLRTIRYSPGAGVPSALQLTASPPEIFQNKKNLIQTMETLSGINSVARGNPESQMGKGSSGAALALIQSMAVQYQSGFQQSYAELLEDCGTFMLQLLKTFAETERMIAMAGKMSRSSMASFSGKDLSNIDRVIVELGNPMTKTSAGRLTLADTLLEKGMAKTPQEYLNVLTTGNLEPMIEGPQAELTLIRQENENLLDKKPVKSIVGDSHLLHMQEHRSLLANPEVRLNGNLTAGVLDHINEHMQLYKTQDPMWSMISGEPPPPPPPMPPMPPPGPPPAGLMPSPGPSIAPTPKEMDASLLPNPAGIKPSQPPQIGPR